MEESVEQQHKNIHRSVRSRLELVQSEGEPQFVPPYMQIGAEQLQAMHQMSQVSPEALKTARLILGLEEDATGLPPLFHDLATEGASDVVIGQLLHYYTTHKTMQFFAAEKVKSGSE